MIIGETNQKVKAHWNIKEALLIILLTGMPLGIILCLALPWVWWFAVITGLFFGIFQYITLRFVRYINKGKIGFVILFFMTIIVGVVIGGLFQYLTLRIPNGNWNEMLAPNEHGTDITFATADFYCVNTVSEAKYCCGFFDQNNDEKCVPDTYTDKEKNRLEKADRFIDHKNHLLYIPGRPVQDGIDTYYVYSGFFEGTVQNIYLLSGNGQVWKFTEFFNGMEVFLIIFTSIVGGFIGFLHSLTQLMIS